MTESSTVFTAVGRKFVWFIIRGVKCTPISIFGILLIIAFIVNTVSPTSPLSLLFVILSYISGTVLIFWVFTLLFRKD